MGCLSLKSIRVDFRHRATYALEIHETENLNDFRFLEQVVVDTHKFRISFVRTKAVAQMVDNGVDRRRQT